MNRFKYRIFFLDLLKRIFLEEYSERIDIPFSEEEFIKESGREGILNFLYLHLYRKNRVLNLSSDAVKKIEEYYFMISARNLRIQKELSTIVTQAKEAGIDDFFIIKGSYLINLIYKDPGTRPMSDVDLIYSPSEFENLKRIFLRNGYVISRDSSEGHHFKKDDQVIFDLIAYEGDFYIGNLRKKISTINYDSVKEYLTEFNLEGTAVPVLEPELNLLLFSDHMRKHYYNRLIWFLDFILMFKNMKINLKKLKAAAEKLHLTKSLSYTQYLLNKYFSWFEFKPESRLKLLETRLLQGIFEGRIEKGNTYLYLFALQNPLNKLILISRKIFPPVREMRFIYKTESNFKLFFYYLTRPFMVFTAFIRNILKIRGEA